MKHPARTEFTAKEANRICQLLAPKLISGRDEQKKIRETIRELGFYISRNKISSGEQFSPSDFYLLVQFRALTLTP